MGNILLEILFSTTKRQCSMSDGFLLTREVKLVTLHYTLHVLTVNMNLLCHASVSNKVVVFAIFYAYVCVACFHDLLFTNILFCKTVCGLRQSYKCSGSTRLKKCL